MNGKESGTSGKTIGRNAIRVKDQGTGGEKNGKKEIKNFEFYL